MESSHLNFKKKSGVIKDESRVIGTAKFKDESGVNKIQRGKWVIKIQGRMWGYQIGGLKMWSSKFKDESRVNKMQG